MRTRILVGVGAWLLGASAATGGSLLAVSLLGQGFVASESQRLTVQAVNRALASEAADAPAASPVASPAAPQPAPTHPHQARNRPRSTPSLPQHTAGIVLTSLGGTVVADCRAGGAYLESWSPQQGYEADDVMRGPAAPVRAVFSNWRKSVTMVVSCSGGIPSATVQTGSLGGDE